MAPGGARYIFKARIARIGVLPGRRPIDRHHVENLRVSFREIGHRAPISLRQVADEDPARDRFTYWLIAGGHRLEAAKAEGWEELDAVLDEDDALTARIAEADENLIRRDLTALERAQALATRLEAWGAKFPERIVVGDGTVAPKRGRPRNSGAVSEFPAQPNMGFSAEAAEKVGLSTRTIERDLAVYRGIPASLQDRLLGTPIAANPALLRQLASVADRDEQARVAEILLSGQTKNVSDAMAIAAGNTPSKPARTEADEAVKAFRAVWGKASPSARAAILHDLAGRPLPKGWIVREADHG